MRRPNIDLNDYLYISTSNDFHSQIVRLDNNMCKQLRNGFDQIDVVYFNDQVWEETSFGSNSTIAMVFTSILENGQIQFLKITWGLHTFVLIIIKNIKSYNC